ncbi:hypothetical protein [Pseudonocardia humida]|uniref:Secreted protein n=1 Tax=Pseudonocardia humida TaxID=2800819 RepID=A0ABT0ZU66_9PSEU|nr:hypothetical protein [Pseudonocardia humida]MCO1654276.1 hypothetical protein [Pseudonocardia humida]
MITLLALFRIFSSAVAWDDVVARLLSGHARTDDGLCAGCTRPGRGTPMLPWPCSLWTLARTARTLAGSRHGPDSPPPGGGRPVSDR